MGKPLLNKEKSSFFQTSSSGLQFWLKSSKVWVECGALMWWSCTLLAKQKTEYLSEWDGMASACPYVLGLRISEVRNQRGNQRLTGLLGIVYIELCRLSHAQILESYLKIVLGVLLSNPAGNLKWVTYFSLCQWFKAGNFCVVEHYLE